MKSMLENDDEGGVVGYMCATDFECELGAAKGGNRIFPSLKDARENLNCAESCGVVEVLVSFRKIALKGKEDYGIEAEQG